MLEALGEASPFRGDVATRFLLHSRDGEHLVSECWLLLLQFSTAEPSQRKEPQLERVRFYAAAHRSLGQCSCR